MTIRLIRGDCRDVLPTLESNSVHCVVSSPPYHGLRSYLPNGHVDKHKEIGLEPTVDEWVANIVLVMREVRRVLRKDGTVWLNLGDSYAGARRGGSTGSTTLRNPGQKVDASAAAAAHIRATTDSRRRDRVEIPRSDVRSPGYKPKDLIGQPWLAAFALRADGWYLRQEIIWSKLNPMPESCVDRCTKAHESVFLLSKSKHYYFDAKAIAEPASENTHDRTRKERASADHKSAPDDIRNGLRPRKQVAGWANGDGDHSALAHNQAHTNGVGFGRGYDDPPKPRTTKLAPAREAKANASFHAAMHDMPDTRNKRSVWTTATEPFKEAHFATMPTELVRPCILAGCPRGGTVLDPFAGAGTVGLVADRLQRNAILIDLHAEYVDMTHRRLKRDMPPLFAEIHTTP